MATTTVFPLANYPDGTHVSPAFAVADGATTIALTMDRCTAAQPTIWPNASTTIVVLVEQLVAAEWRELGGFGTQGGIAQDKSGADAPVSRGTCALLPGTARQVRARATIAGGALRSAGVVNIT